MASRRAQRRAACDGKQRHATHAEAVNHATSHLKRLGQYKTVYKCQFCNGWHIGTPPAKIRRAIKQKRADKARRNPD